MTHKYETVTILFVIYKTSKNKTPKEIIQYKKYKYNDF